VSTLAEQRQAEIVARLGRLRIEFDRACARLQAFVQQSPTTQDFAAIGVVSSTPRREMYGLVDVLDRLQRITRLGHHQPQHVERISVGGRLREDLLVQGLRLTVAAFLEALQRQRQGRLQRARSAARHRVVHG
jgi:hypothetical protein